MFVQRNIVRSSSVLNFIRSNSNSSISNDANWSYGEKKKPKNWKHQLENWYKLPDFKKREHNMNPNDPEHQYPYKLPDGGIQYFHFVYYPR